MNTAVMQKRFLKSLDTYNDNAKIQKKMAEKLLSYLDTARYDDILEIGCGTGLLTKLAVNRLEYNSYTANDILAECEGLIKNIEPGINFYFSNIEESINSLDKTYDLIISNASFQWFKNIEEFLPKLISKLKPNGTLLFSTFGPENFRELNYILGISLPYLSKREYETLLKEYSPVIDEEIHVLAFKTPTDVLRHLKLTGVNSLENKSWTKHDMFKFEDDYNNYCPTAPILTYNPMYIKLVRAIK